MSRRSPLWGGRPVVFPYPPGRREGPAAGGDEP